MRQGNLKNIPLYITSWPLCALLAISKQLFSVARFLCVLLSCLVESVLGPEKTQTVRYSPGHDSPSLPIIPNTDFTLDASLRQCLYVVWFIISSFQSFGVEWFGFFSSRTQRLFLNWAWHLQNVYALFCLVFVWVQKRDAKCFCETWISPPFILSSVLFVSSTLVAR